jgi:hypothetical protein
MQIDFSEVHPLNAWLPIWVSLESDSNVNDAMEEQP